MEPATESLVSTFRFGITCRLVRVYGLEFRSISVPNSRCFKSSKSQEVDGGAKLGIERRREKETKASVLSSSGDSTK